MSELKFYQKGLELSCRAAAEGTVLLKNDNNVLPLDKSEKVALFGRNQCDTYKGCGGAADLWAVKVQPFADGMEKVGNVYEPMLKKYRATSKANYDPALNKFHHSFNLHKYSLPEVRLTDAEVAEAAAVCDTAVIFIGRFTIEGRDIKDEQGQYRITNAEEVMIKQVTTRFKNTVMVLNTPGSIDLSFLNNYKIDALVAAFMPGIMAGDAIANVLYGNIPPCGRLPDTWAQTADEYPTNEGFSTDKIVYSEGIYMGYKYFDTFGKDVVYPFGYGLSYTEFGYDEITAQIDKTTVIIKVTVTNNGEFEGRDVVQCYLSAPDGELDKPYQVLCGFEKTKWLGSEESETVVLKIDLTKFSSYNEKTAEYILEKGDYVFRVGKHSRDTKPVCVVNIDETVVCKKVKNLLTPKQDINELKKDAVKPQNLDGVLKLKADFSDFKTVVVDYTQDNTEYKKVCDCSFADVKSGKNTPEELAACLTDDELAQLLTGDGFAKQQSLGLDDKPLVEGEGTHTHSVARLGIPSSVMQDGPNGVRASTFVAPPLPPEEEIYGRDCVCYPSATMLAATWDKDLLVKVGEAISVDLDRIGYNGLCAPGVNLHRNPRCGRNFEYFSEDPYLSAQMAIGMINGVQQNADGTPSHRYAVLKHLACNNSEDMRLESDSILSERCARELYLRVVEYVLDETEPLSIMSAYNKVNGVYASAIDCLKAGADTVMPGDYIPFEKMLEGGLTKPVAQKRAASLIKHLAKTKNYFDGKLEE